MRITLHDNKGAALHAKVEVEAEGVVLHSRGGAFGKSNLRNPDYAPALRLILARLSAAGIAPTGVWLDSGVARRFPLSARQLLNAAEAAGPPNDVAALIGERGAAWGRAANAQGPGNMTKRVLIGITSGDRVTTAAALGKVSTAADGSGATPLTSAAPVMGTAMPPVIYFNIGWMKWYRGPSADDPTLGAHGYLGTHTHGAECFNFAPVDGRVRGYRPPGARDRTSITRLGAAPGADSIDGVLVVWLAREPKSGTTLVVGWYQNATVYRDARDGGRDLNGERHCYTAEARVEDAVLISPGSRSFAVPSSRTRPGGGFGQKPTWYGANDVDARVVAYVRARSGNAPPTVKNGKPPRNNDPELRRKVERAAVDHARAYYKDRFGPSCDVTSVEALARGWDLEVEHDAGTLLVEVKGLLNHALVCELTPNEYEKMMLADNRANYVVYVLTNALAEAPAVPIPSIFTHLQDDIWETEDGRRLVISPKIGAVLSCSPAPPPEAP